MTYKKFHDKCIIGEDRYNINTEDNGELGGLTLLIHYCINT